MSGPKAHEVHVVDEAELRRREDAARYARCQSHVARLKDLAQELQRFDVASTQAVQAPSSATHEALISWEQNLREAIAIDQHRVTEASARAILKRLNEAKAAVDVTGVRLGGRLIGSVDAPNRSEVRKDLGRIAADVDKIVGLVGSVRDASLREELTLMAERVLRVTNAAQAKGDLLTLKTRASNALLAQECQILAEDALLEIAHLISPEAEALRSRAATVGYLREVDEIRRAVAVMIDVDAKARDAKFVETALEDALEELGFALNEGFALTEFDRSVAIAEHPDHPRYGVRVQLNPANSMIYTRVVAKHETTPVEDTRAEAATCEKVHALAEGLRQRGVAAELKSEREPGEVPVERYQVTAAATRRTRQRPRTTPQSRALR